MTAEQQAGRDTRRTTLRGRVISNDPALAREMRAFIFTGVIPIPHTQGR